MIITLKSFAGLSVMTVSDLLELPSDRRKLTFSQFFEKDSMKHLLGLQLWHLFEYAGLIEAVRQNDELFIVTCLKKFEMVTLLMM